MKNEQILREAAEALKAAGYVVYVWQNDSYNRSWQKGDYTSVVFGKEGDPAVAALRHGDYGFGLIYGREYVPGNKNGSGCRMAEASKFSIEEAEAICKASLPKWLNNPVVQYKDIRDWKQRCGTSYLFNEL